MNAERIGSMTICAVLLALFAWLSWSASEQESPTTDEPLDAAGGYVQMTMHDFRVDREDPPLCAQWAMLPQPQDALRLDTQSPEWAAIPGRMWLGNTWSVRTLFQTPGNNGDSFIRRSRAMFLLLGISLGALLATWSWRLAGPLAAVFTTTLYCLDPNFLAHAPLVKNDVALAFSLALLGFGLWRGAVRLTPSAIGIVCFACFIAAGFKFSGLLLIPFAAVTLALLAISPAPWPTSRLLLTTRPAKFTAVALVVIASSLFTWLGLWACYGGRYAPSVDPSVRLDIESSAGLARRYGAMLRIGGTTPTAEDVSATPEPLSVKLIRSIDQHHLMPQAWCSGAMFTLASTMARPTFLFGEYGWKGWWYYFPLAALCKTPIATLVATAIALVFALRRRPWGTRPHRRAILCLAIPFALYAVIAMSSSINIGLRHFLPVYPAVYVSTGVIAANVWTGSRGRLLIVALIAGLAGETLGAYPNYIPFFNVAAGGSRGGARILSDSNLDWGQDLKRLVAWQQSHPGVDLYVAYVGSVDPRFYSLRFAPLIGNSNPPGTLAAPAGPGIMAVSVSLIQGIYGQADRNALYAPLRAQKPLEILGGSIYLYRTQGNGVIKQSD